MMQNFPIKKGINISRMHQPIPQFQAYQRQPQKMPQQMNRTLPPQITVMNRLPNYNFEFNQNQNVQMHNRTLSSHNANTYQQKIIHTQAMKPKPLPVESYSNENMHFIFPSPNHHQQTQMAGSKVAQPRQQLELTKYIQELTKTDNKISAQSVSLPQMKQIPYFSKQKQPLKEIKQISNANIPSHDPNQQKIWSQKITNLQRQKQQLQRQLKAKIQHQKNKQWQSWQSQKVQLIKSINEKTIILKQNQQKTTQIQQQLKSKIASLQYQLRLLKGNKNRLEIQIESNKKIVRSQRQKNEKAKQQMNKLIFFEDDLIHAKDYNKLKDQLQYVHSENTKLFQQHQQYILEVTQYRKSTEDKLIQISNQLVSLKLQYSEYRSKIESYIQNGQDKMALIKLQNELNFIKNKSEQQSQQLRLKEQQLEKAMFQIKQLSMKQQEPHRNFMEQINIKQIQQTISLYEQRITDLQSNLNKKQLENDKQRKTIELLTTQLRNTRQDRHINSIKGKSCQNSLKNQVEILNKFYQTQIQVKDKKIYNLQESIQRKSKQISQKDLFIKQFLIARVKKFENTAAQSLMQNIRQYFSPKQQEIKNE